MTKQRYICILKKMMSGLRGWEGLWDSSGMVGLRGWEGLSDSSGMVGLRGVPGTPWDSLQSLPGLRGWEGLGKIVS